MDPAHFAALKADFEANGGKWIDMAVAGGAGDAAMTVLRSRVLSGDPPAAAQIKDRVGRHLDTYLLQAEAALAEARDQDRLPGAAPEHVADRRRAVDRVLVRVVDVGQRLQHREGLRRYEGPLLDAGAGIEGMQHPIIGTDIDIRIARTIIELEL